MLQAEEFGSDSSDEDYIPSASEDYIPSASDSSEKSESEQETNLESTLATLKRKIRKQSKKRKKTRLDDREFNEKVKAQSFTEHLTEEDEILQNQKAKEKADNLWCDFMKDTNFQPRTKSNESLKKECSLATAQVSSSSSSSKPRENTKISLTKEYDFAGETIKVTKEVDVNSKEAQSLLVNPKSQLTKPSPELASTQGLKSKESGGIKGVLNKIEKKTKIGTLEKSKIDWQSFKSEEGIEEELEIYNRGKNGYTERQAFLQRTDIRQFEIERNIRLSKPTT